MGLYICSILHTVSIDLGTIDLVQFLAKKAVLSRRMHGNPQGWPVSKMKVLNHRPIRLALDMTPRVPKIDRVRRDTCHNISLYPQPDQIDRPRIFLSYARAKMTWDFILSINPAIQLSVNMSA